MSIRQINTTISTIRGLYDENGNYLPSGNYYFKIKEYDDNIFKGKLNNFGNFCFSPKKLIKMMAVGQSRLAKAANIMEDGMPDYPFPTSEKKNYSNYVVQPFFQRVTENQIISRQQCSICLEDIFHDNKKTLSCNHSFHKNCINRWFNQQTNCPLCRKSHTSNQNENETNNNWLLEDVEEDDIPGFGTLESLISNNENNHRYRRIHRNNNRTLIFPSRFSRK